MNATNNDKQDKVKVQLDKIVNLFSSQELPYKCAKAFIMNGNKPSSKWSLSNKVIMLSNDSMDARGYRQWQEVKRQVPYGQKASFYILAPKFIKVQKENKETKEMEDIKVISGFLGIPVWKYEDTQGEELPEYKPKELPPLMDVANKLGLKVQYSDGGQELGYYGSYDQNKTITLKTFDNSTFFHELVHAIDKHINGTKIISKDSIEYALNEVVAELTACVIGELYNMDNKNYSYTYIKSYAEQIEKSGTANEKIARSMVKVIGRVEKILKFVFNEQEVKPEITA